MNMDCKVFCYFLVYNHLLSIGFDKTKTTIGVILLMVIAVIVILAVIRSVMKGLPIENGFKDTSNWLLAALSGACAGWSSYNKDLKKEEKEKKDNKE